MLVVHRKEGQRLVLSGGIEISVVSTARGGVRLAITAPPDVWIARGEVHDAVALANAAAAATTASIYPNIAPGQGLEAHATEDSR
jgi:carbon storage regulator CsrA